MSVVSWLVLTVLVLAVVVVLAAWWYKRATNEVSILGLELEVVGWLLMEV